MPLKKQPCIVDGVRYESEIAAAKDLEIALMMLRARLRSSNFPNYTSKHHTKIKRGKQPVPVPCIIKGIEYPSLTNAAKKLKTSDVTIRNRLRSLKYPDYVCAIIPKKPPKPPKYRYTVNGRKYRTLQEIGDMEGVTKERIRQKMNDPKYLGYKRI